MTISNHLEHALLNLMAAKLRSFLAVLGILVGTAAVVALINCSQLATEKALEQFKALGTNLLAVSVFQTSQKAEIASSGKPYIPLEIWHQFPTMIPGIQHIAPYTTAYQPLRFQDKTLNGVIIGADESLANIIHIQLTAGRFVSSIESYDHVCVIGDKLARQLQQASLDSVINKQLRIGQALYTIVGITAPWLENAFFNEDINQAVIIPIKGMALISQDAKINNAIIVLNPTAKLDVVIEQITQRIKVQSPLLNVFIRSAKQIIASMEDQAHIFTLLLGVIGGISLLVGGIGIMNVMLVSVSERKKEIGIRKAIGATNQAIQTLFLTESIILSLAGGVLGVVVGCVFTLIIAWFNHWPLTLFATPIIAGFAVSVITGMFFGFYPARRAARLEPIVSLRSE